MTKKVLGPRHDTTHHETARLTSFQYRTTKIRRPCRRENLWSLGENLRTLARTQLDDRHCCNPSSLLVGSVPVTYSKNNDDIVLWFLDTKLCYVYIIERQDFYSSIFTQNDSILVTSVLTQEGLRVSLLGGGTEKISDECKNPTTGEEVEVSVAVS